MTSQGQLAPMTRFLRQLVLADHANGVSDDRLLAQFVNEGDATALTALVKRHASLVWAVCRRVLANQHDAEDAFQATFLVLVRRAGSVRKPEFVASWLHGVAHRTALRVRAKTSRSQGEGNLPEGLLATDPLPELAWRELQPVLDEEVQRLPEKYRAPFVLCYLEDKTYVQVARQLNWPTGTVSKRLAQAREVLRMRLARRGFTISAGLLGTVLSQQVGGAAVPSVLVDSTITAATTVAAGGAATSIVSAKVAALTEGMMRVMFLTKLKHVTAALLFVAVLGFATRAVTDAVFAGGQGPPDQKAVLDEQETSSPRVEGPRHDQDNLTAWKTRSTLQGHQDEVLCLAFGADQVATASKDGTIKLWDAVTGKQERACKYPSEVGAMRFMAFTTDGKHLLVGFGDQMGFWDTSKESFPKGALGGTSPMAIALGPDDGYTWLMLQEGKNVRVWEVSRLGAVNPDILGFGSLTTRAVLRHSADVHAAVLSPDREVLAAGIADRTIRLWNVGTKKEIATCKGHDDDVLALVFSPDGKTLASAGKDGSVRLWETATGKEQRILKRHTGAVRSVAFAPDGKTVASGGDDRAVIVWDAVTARPLASLKGHADAVLHVCFSRDSQLLASASKDRTVKLWEVKK